MTCIILFQNIFLKKNIPVFIDKPLTSKIKELNFFKKYLKSALLMSSSGLRFANEVNLLKKNQKKLGRIKSVNALVLNDFFKYFSPTCFGKNQVMKLVLLQAFGASHVPSYAEFRGQSSGIIIFAWGPPKPNF